MSREEVMRTMSEEDRKIRVDELMFIRQQVVEEMVDDISYFIDGVNTLNEHMSLCKERGKEIEWLETACWYFGDGGRVDDSFEFDMNEFDRLGKKYCK